MVGGRTQFWCGHSGGHQPHAAAKTLEQRCGNGRYYGHGHQQLGVQAAGKEKNRKEAVEAGVLIWLKLLPTS